MCPTLNAQKCVALPAWPAIESTKNEALEVSEKASGYTMLETEATESKRVFDLMIGRIKLLRQLLDPTINLLRPIPVTAWLPLSMIFFGLGPNAAIFLVFLGAFYPILLNTIFGVRSVDVRLFEAAAMLGCSGSAMFRQIVFPASLPAIFNGLRIAHGFAWILIVVGEMTGVPTGLGSVIMDGRTLSRTDLVVTGMIVIGVCGFVTDRIIVVISNRVLQWSPQHHA